MKKSKEIPKIIHYCWFGRGPLPDEAIKCIETWKKFMPDYIIKEWNEENFDVNCCKYVKEAYDCKKYAFVSDYARLYALYSEGGVYMDTDVEVIKSYDEFLTHSAFAGFENADYITTGIIGSTKNNNWIKTLLKDYDNLSFIKTNGEMDLTTNVIRVTETTTKNYDIKLNNEYQELKDFVIYPEDYFCPKDWDTEKVVITDNTHAIHHFVGSWHSDAEKKQQAKKKKYLEKYGKERGNKKYEKYLKQKKVLNYFTYPLKAIKNPKKAFQRIIGKD